MQLWSVLGQYLLLSFVLPGFCYLAAFYLCFPGALGRVFPGVLGQIGPGVPLKKDGSPSTQGKTDNNEEDDNSEDDEEDDNEEGGKKKGAKKEASQGFWVTLLAVIFGLLLSSVTFFLEIMLRKSRDFDCKWFTRIPFDKLAAPAPDNPLANFLAAETIMHFNIAVGFLIIFAIWIGIRGKSICSGPYLYLAVGFIAVIISNLFVSSYLFDRTAVAAYKSEKGAEKAREACEKSRPHASKINFTLASSTHFF